MTPPFFSRDSPFTCRARRPPILGNSKTKAFTKTVTGDAADSALALAPRSARPPGAGKGHGRRLDGLPGQSADGEQLHLTSDRGSRVGFTSSAERQPGPVSAVGPSYSSVGAAPAV